MVVAAAVVVVGPRGFGERDGSGMRQGELLSVNDNLCLVAFFYDCDLIEDGHAARQQTYGSVE